MKVVFLVLLAFILGACGSKECKNGEECLKLGWSFWNKKEFQKSFEAFKKSCELESPEACWRLRDLYHFGIKIQKDEQKANEYYQKTLEFAKKSCDKDNAQACYILGNSYATQNDEDEAQKYRQKACELGNYRACIVTGLRIKTEEAMAHYQKTFEFAKEACQKDDWNACFSLKTFYGKDVKNLMEEKEFIEFYQMYEEKKLIELYQKGFKLAQKECLAGDYYQACFALGNLYKDKQDPLKYVKEALGIFHRDTGEESEDKQQAKEYFQKACDVANPFACLSLGDLYRTEDNTKAKEYYQQACELGSYRGCKSLKDLRE